MASNNGPSIKWFRTDFPCGTVRYRLYVNGAETPYFVDDAKKAGRGHWRCGEPVGLLGAGMGAEIRRRDGSSYQIAADLGGFRNVTLAKTRAERLALS